MHDYVTLTVLFALSVEDWIFSCVMLVTSPGDLVQASRQISSQSRAVKQLHSLVTYIC